jgi:hypothetical protein
MERIAALVEGHTEHHFMHATYPKVIVQRCIPNGDDVNLDLIVSAIRDQLEVLGGEIRKVVILFDREGRATDAEEVAQYVRDKISDQCNHRKIYIGVSDREVENWIVSDQENMIELYGDKSYLYPGDGHNGKSTLKKLHGVDPAPRDKATILKSCSAQRAGENSPSLKSFLDSIDFDWPWAKS